MYSPQSDPGTSSGTRSSSSIDTDCQANINYGRQLALTSVKGGSRPHPASIGELPSRDSLNLSRDFIYHDLLTISFFDI